VILPNHFVRCLAVILRPIPVNVRGVVYPRCFDAQVRMSGKLRFSESGNNVPDSSIREEYI
jgi:hypothetical protein